MNATRSLGHGVSAAIAGIIHREEDPELRRHREEVLEKSRVWRVVFVLCAVTVGAAIVEAVLDTLFG